MDNNNQKKSFSKKVIAFTTSVAFITAAVGISVAIASLTFTTNNLQSDTALTVDANGTLTIGNSTATLITIGRTGQLVAFPGNASTSGTFTISATGTPIVAHLSATGTVGPLTFVTPYLCTSSAITVNGATAGDAVYAAPTPTSTGVETFSSTVWSAYVSTTSMAAVRICVVSPTSGLITIGSQIWRADVWKH